MLKTFESSTYGNLIDQESMLFDLNLAEFSQFGEGIIKSKIDEVDEIYAAKNKQIRAKYSVQLENLTFYANSVQ